MDYPNEWEEIENAYDADHYSDRPLQGAPTLKGFSLSDFLIIKNWIGYARGIDDSVAGFSLQRIGQIGFWNPRQNEKRSFHLLGSHKLQAILATTLNQSPSVRVAKWGT